MGNCLKTQLKEVVNNDNLNKLGEYCLTIKDGGPGPTLVLRSFLPSANLRIVGSGKFYTDGTYTTEIGQETTYQDVNTTIYINGCSDGDKLFISDMYDLYSFVVANNGGYIKDSSFNSEYMQKLRYCEPFYWANLSMNLNEFIIGKRDIEHCYFLGNTLISGEIETVTESLINQGRNSGTLEIFAAYSAIKLHNENFFSDKDPNTAMIIEFSGNTATVSWENNVIANYNGSTWTYNS